jgi:hypothetical protein
MNPYLGLPLETLTEALALAQAALPTVSRGEAVTAIATGDQRISFAPTDANTLIQQIGYLRQAIAILENPTAPRRVYAVARFPQC